MRACGAESGFVAFGEAKKWSDYAGSRTNPKDFEGGLATGSMTGDAKGSAIGSANVNGTAIAWADASAMQHGCSSPHVGVAMSGESLNSCKLQCLGAPLVAALKRKPTAHGLAPAALAG